MIEITVKILAQNNKLTELGAIYEGKNITIDPCVGCAIPFSVFVNYDFVGNTYTFNGSWHSKDSTLFLPEEMYDPIE